MASTTTRYRVHAGIDYDGKRAEPGDIVDDLPRGAITDLKDAGVVTLIPKGEDPRDYPHPPADGPYAAAAPEPFVDPAATIVLGAYREERDPTGAPLPGADGAPSAPAEPGEPVTLGATFTPPEAVAPAVPDTGAETVTADAATAAEPPVPATASAPADAPATDTGQEG